ncbi:hypothetical protein HRED_07514 [Candidatus Haloredivivus sp. G17]|nr:hypothetical protein HRED_07514 [Candidatus Haloredivivus sp. G17]
MNVVNKGPGDARDIEIRAISFAGFFGERSPEKSIYSTTRKS